MSFPSYEELRECKVIGSDPTRLYSEEVAEDYIAVVKNPDYARAIEYKNPDTRAQYLTDNGLRMLRPYQVRAVKALQQSVSGGGRRFLFEMATGTGKTLASAAVIRLFLRSRAAHKVLFLVDRLELEGQARKSFKSCLMPDYQTLIFKENRDDWRKADIVVSTVQSLMSGDKYKRYFRPSDFSLLIVDESHRSIGGNARAVFEYFSGYKLGLTATPKVWQNN